MISTAQSATELLHRGPTEHTERMLDMFNRCFAVLKEEYSTPGISPVKFLTVNHVPHILEKTMDDLEGLRRSYPSLISSEPIQPLKYRLDVLPPEEQLLDKRFYVAWSGNIISPLTRTHSVFLAVTAWSLMRGWRVSPQVSL